MSKSIFIVLTLVWLSACTKEQLKYGTYQTLSTMSCQDKAKIAGKYGNCQRPREEEFKDYQKQRKEVLGE